ncbi:MAG: hypothetical protein ACLQUZ_16250 [Rhizomicrobium sp.]
MQVSALNLIIAAQQARAGGTTSRPAASPVSPPSSGPAETKQADATVPVTFNAADAAPCAPAARTAANPFATLAPLGSQLDIRV